MDGTKKVGVLSVLALLGAGLKLVGAVAGSNRHSGSLYSSMTPTRDLQEFRELSARAALRKKLEALREQAIERHCALSTRPRYLEPQGPMDPISVVAFSEAFPFNFAFPPTFTVKGLAVRAYAMDGQDLRVCLDVTQGMADQLATERPRFSADSLQKLGKGVWVLESREGDAPAIAALLSTPFLKELGPQSLVAFAPIEEVVTFADASDPAAVRAAAKAIVERVDANDADISMQAQPLLFKAGIWSTWTPKQPSREIQQAQRLGRVLEAKSSLRLVTQLMNLETTSAELAHFGLDLKRVAVPVGTVSSLEIDEHLKTTALIAPSGTSLIAQADFVVIGEQKPVSWKTFSATHAKELEPVVIEGAIVPSLVKWSPAFAR